MHKKKSTLPNKPLQLVKTPPPTKGARINLASAKDLRRFLNKIIRETYAGTMPEGQAKALGYLIGLALTGFKQQELENRIEILEGKRQ